MLFPDDPPSGLVGIARLAAAGDLLEAKRRVRYFELETRSLIGRVSGRRMPFDWTINPYRGCEFGCKYCYARYTHEFMELHEWRQFEEQIYAKRFDPASFRRELAKIPAADSIAIGTATDPYQPAERRYRVTRGILSVLAEDKRRKLSLVTKSGLVTRDLDLFSAIARANTLHICITITTMNEKLARLLEPYAPRPANRIDAVRALASAGIRVAVLHNPVMPFINDSEKNMAAVAEAAARAGTGSIGTNVLFLKPCARKAFFPFLEEHFPHQVRRYHERYQSSAFLRGEYPKMISERMERVRKRYGLADRGVDYRPELWEPEPQLSLFEIAPAPTPRS
ncbi:MAG: radical SAM protein [Acidobacteria bacterium]|nr:radical SAM protein [Acidobacteriota bacterium]